jgi:protein-disulfide isomerase
MQKNFLLVLLVLAAFGAGLTAGYVVWGQTSVDLQRQYAELQRTTAPTAIPRVTVQLDNDPVWGPQDAVVTIVEFSDYECPYCKRWHAEIWPKLEQAYAGKIKLVYRDFPLTAAHPNAVPAAEAANCAGEQGQYYPFYDRLWLAKSGLNSKAYETYATELGLDLASFKSCVATRKYRAEVEADLRYATTLGVSGTPTFFINGIRVIGAQPFDVFKNIIDRERAAKK